MTPPPTTPAHGPLSNTSELRICHIRAIDTLGPAETGDSVLHVFELGRLANGVDTAGSLAPQLLATSSRAPIGITGTRWSADGGREVAWQRLRLLIPGGGIADVRVMSTPWESTSDTINLLEDLCYEAIRSEPGEWDTMRSPDCQAAVTAVRPFHQLVFVPSTLDEPDWETIQRLVYRADLDAIEEQSSISHPEELNRRPGQLAAVGRFGSVLWGLQDYVESAIVLSAAMTVSAASTAATVRRLAHDHLRTYRDATAGGGSADLPGLRKAIAELGLDLAFGAEGHATIDHLLPSLRVSSFHRALYTAADVRSQIDLAARMIDRLTAVAI